MKNFYSFFMRSVLLSSLIVLLIISGCKKEDDEIEEGPIVIQTGTVSDIDGNVYKTVILGTQEWMAENLKTTRYSNGEEIDYPGTDNEAWSLNTTGAYAWHGNDESFKNLYGGLYNWYAVNNPNNICPAGWRVPSHQEWGNLIQYLTNVYKQSNVREDVNALGNRLKSCRQRNSPMGSGCSFEEHPRWNAHDVHYGTNDFEFSALPGGDRLYNGNYSSLGRFGFFWSGTSVSETHSNIRYINFDRSIVFLTSSMKNYGHSVRCIKQ
jgi:uncharacterized protein (TIGR02145 family)